MKRNTITFSMYTSWQQVLAKSARGLMDAVVSEVVESRVSCWLREKTPRESVKTKRTKRGGDESTQGREELKR